MVSRREGLSMFTILPVACTLIATVSLGPVSAGAVVEQAVASARARESARTEGRVRDREDVFTTVSIDCFDDAIRRNAAGQREGTPVAWRRPDGPVGDCRAGGRPDSVCAGGSEGGVCPRPGTPGSRAIPGKQKAPPGRGFLRVRSTGVSGAA